VGLGGNLRAGVASALDDCPHVVVGGSADAEGALVRARCSGLVVADHPTERAMLIATPDGAELIGGLRWSNL
jgi:hypothetical protein